jgi:hypothetical protein
MRTFPFTVSSALGIHALITIYQPNGTLRVTTAPIDVTIGGDTWAAQGAVNLTQVQFSADGTASSADVRIASNSAGPIKPGMSGRGLLDGLNILVQLFNLGNPAAGLFNLIPGATIGSVSEDTNGVVVLGVQGRLALLGAPMAEVYTTVCKARLGDSRCRVPLDVSDVARGQAYIVKASMDIATGNLWGANQTWVRKFDGGSYNDRVYECTTAGTTAGSAPTYPTTIGATVTDGTAVFTCRQAFLVAATGQALDFFNIQLDAAPSVDPSALGMIIPRTGDLKDTKIQIRAYDSGTLIVTLWEPYSPSNFPAATVFEVHPGCDRILDTCRDVFNNLNNMRATTYAPNSSLLTGRS